MKSLPTSHCRNRVQTSLRAGRSPGFTMIEMMAAVTVLAMMFTMMTQMLNTITRSCSEGQQRANNFTKARAMLDMMARDVQSGIYRSDLDWTVSNASGSTILSLYTQRPGIGMGDDTRNVSLVQYSIDTDTVSTLQRSDYAIGWASNATAIPFSNSSQALPAPMARDAAPGVVACGVRYIRSDGRVVTTYDDTVRAVAITIAVVDDTTLKQLSSSTRESLIGEFTMTMGSDERSLKEHWEREVSSIWSSGDYPKSLNTGLKIFERYVPITPQ